MKIAFVSQPLDRVVPPMMNSIGIWTNEIARRLAKSYDVTVYARGGLRPGPGIGEAVKTIFVRTIPKRWMAKLTRKMELRSTPQRPFFSSGFFALEYSLQVAISAMLQGAEVIHIQNFSQFVPIIRAFNPRAKIALHMRCEWLTQLDHDMIASRLKQTDLIFGVSDYITNKIRAAFPEHSHKCFSIVNGVDTELFKAKDSTAPASSPDEGLTILMVGRISPEKGVHVLIEAFVQIADRFPDTRLVLVGPGGSVSKDQIIELSDDEKVNGLLKFYQGGTYYEHLMALIPERLRGRIQFTGAVGYHQVIDYYQNSYVLANPSLSESFGRSLIEANACELPIIAARAGGMVEVVEPGVNGLLVESGCPQAFATALTQLLENPALHDRMATNGRKRVLELYSWDRICASLVDAYQYNPYAAGQHQGDGETDFTN